MRRVVIFVMAVLLLAATLLVVGWLRPPGHTATTQALYPVSQQQAWDSLTAFDRWSEWYPEVSKVEMLPDSAGNRRILITGEWGEIPTTLTVWDPPHRLRTQMDEGTFKGSWSWDLRPVPEGTMVTVTESGEVRSPFFRALMIFNDNAATMLNFHRAYAQRLGVSVEPTVVDESAERGTAARGGADSASVAIRAAAPTPQDSALRSAAEDIVAFLRGTAVYETLSLADTVELVLPTEGGGTRHRISRDVLREPHAWTVQAHGQEYSFVPAANLTEMAVALNRHFNCHEGALAGRAPEFAGAPHVGVRLAPPRADSCLQGWNVTFVFDTTSGRPELTAAIYDQWEW